ncbi:MAG: serine/threonine-protein kinase [Myxococcota bacterium]
MAETFPASPDDGLAIAGEIGSGAIATVVRIHDRARGGSYAGKILHERHTRDPSAHRRFQREAELASRLAHENLVRVWGTRQIDGRTVMLMELVEGPDLSTALARSGPMAESDVVALARGIAAGLSFAHSAGVIHRDLKPANVLLAPGRGHGVPKIADFGMARASSFAGADKGALTVLGTPQYMAPECLEPLAVDPRTDLYALGCMVFEMATGDPPFGGATPFAVLQAHRETAVPELPGQFSDGLRRLVRRLLAKAPGDRPQSASAVVDALDRLGSGALVAVGPHGLAKPSPRAESVAEGHCAQCGEKVLRELRVCFACGLAQVIVERGTMTVFVVGPGRSPNKLDSGLRDRLVRWLRANAVAGLDATRLEAQIPRLPFTLVTSVSERSARTLETSLACLGIDARWGSEGRWTGGGMLKKSMVLTSRTAMLTTAIAATPAMVHPALALVTMPFVAATLPVIYGVTLVKTSRAFVEVTTTTTSVLPPRIQELLSRLHTVVASIGERRHREALRTVVNRVVALCRGIRPDDVDRPELEAEMEHAITLAAHASQRMDELDRVMAQPGFDPADPSHRHSMHERDMWGARLLDLTAALDSLVARRAAAEAEIRAAQPDELHDLRAMVEALEEVQRQ